MQTGQVYLSSSVMSCSRQIIDICCCPQICCPGICCFREIYRSPEMCCCPDICRPELCCCPDICLLPRDLLLPAIYSLCVLVSCCTVARFYAPVLLAHLLHILPLQQMCDEPAYKRTSQSIACTETRQTWPLCKRDNPTRIQGSAVKLNG